MGGCLGLVRVAAVYGVLLMYDGRDSREGRGGEGGGAWRGGGGGRGMRVCEWVSQPWQC